MKDNPGDFVLRGHRVVTPQGVRPAAIHVASGRIARVSDPSDVPAGVMCVEAGDDLVLPGLVDAHVHMNDPGREDWEGIPSATSAAAAGGITTVVDMPLNSIPPTTTRPGWEAKVAAIDARAHVDVALWGGLVPGNTRELAALAGAGVAGIKCFLSPSGVDEFPNVGAADLEEALPVLRDLGLPLLVHAESPAVLDRAAAGVSGDPRSYARYLTTRPVQAELGAVHLMIDLCRRHGAATHIVHVSSAEAVAAIALAMEDGLPLTAETCPHYLVFAAEDIEDGATVFKCAPPIREASHLEALWNGLATGTLSMIASDHSPCPPALKQMESGDFLSAWGGIAGLQTMLSVVWTAARSRGHGAQAVVRWLAEQPAARAGIAGRKGRIAADMDADFVIFDDDATFTVEPGSLLHRHAPTPYSGLELTGVVRQTYVRGRLAFDRTRGVTEPAGQFLPVRRHGAESTRGRS